MTTTEQREAIGTRVLWHTMELRAIHEEAREVDFICSTEDLDAHGTIIRQDGWDFSRFRNNPTVLYSHNASEIPIGQAVAYEVVKKKLLATIRIASERANPKAEQVWQSILEKTLRGISVGFVPLEYHFEKGKEGEEEILVFDRCMLAELSITPLPSNANTLAQVRQLAMAGRTAPALPAAAPAPTTITAADPPSHEQPATERGEQQENRMDLKDENAALKTTVEKREAEVRATEADLTATRKLLETERAAKAAIERELDKTRDDLKAATDRAAKAEEEVVVRDVEKLIGDKLYPAERDEMLELAKSNRDLFDRLMAKRAPIKETRAAMPPESTDQSVGNADEDADTDIAALAAKGE